jgi:hypothetical protein
MQFDQWSSIRSFYKRLATIKLDLLLTFYVAVVLTTVGVEG